MPESVAVNVRNRSHRVVAEVDLGDAPRSVEGVLVAQGSGFGGWSLYAQGGRLHYLHNFVGLEQQSLRAPLPSAPGPHALGYRFTKTAEHAGVVELVIDGEAVDRMAIERFTPVRWAITGEGLCVGFQDGLPVSREYRGPFRFTGTLQRVVVEVDGPESVDPAAEAELSMRAQ